MSLTPPPPAPSRSDPPATFIAKADTYLAWQATFVAEMEAALAVAGITLWVSGTTYAVGDTVWSPTDYRSYRRIIAGAGTTDPVSDAVNWLAVPLAASGTKYPVRVATTGLTNIGPSAPLVVDGVTLAAGDRVLVRIQAGASPHASHGIYTVTTPGTGANGTWTRATDADSAGDLFGGMLVAVSEGTANGNSLWMLTTDDPITIGTTALTFARIKVLSADILGTTTNDNAAAGVVGEYVQSEVLLASSISISATTFTNITSISLTAGDWDISANFGIDPAATTSLTVFTASTSLTSATIDAPNSILDRRAAYVPAASLLFGIPSRRLSLASTTTVYLVGYVDFSVSTCKAYGKISARRVR